MFFLAIGSAFSARSCEKSREKIIQWAGDLWKVDLIELVEWKRAPKFCERKQAADELMMRNQRESVVVECTQSLRVRWKAIKLSGIEQ